MAQNVVVEVKSPWYSKINWVQVGLGLLSAIITWISGDYIGMSPETKVKVLGALNLIQGLATVIIKTYFSPTVTPQSLPS